MCRMDKNTLISIWGSRAKLAAALGEGESTVRNWFNRGSIPHKYDARLMDAAKKAGHEVTPVHLFEVRQSLSGAST